MVIPKLLSRSLIPLLLLPMAIACREPVAETEINTQIAASDAPSLNVVATFLPMYWFTRAVTGDSAQVQALIPPGTDVHEYQARPADVQAIATANILVKNGLGLEEFLENTIANANNPNLTQINASAGIQPLDNNTPVVKAVDSSHDHDDDHDHDHAEGNPHVWLDPVLAQQQVTTIRDGLIAADPANQAIYEANSAAYLQQLQQLDEEFRQTLSQYPNCTFITFHDAYPYIANRYNLQQVAVVSVPDASLSPQDLQKTVQAVQQYQAKALFSEPQVENRVLRTLATDLNLPLYEIDPLESGPLDPQHYLTAMRGNLETIANACR
ncbi:zinc ABC transporter substrate-binding protein [Phormidium pseudopriestleyi FRX01]|uniref:Zinc ABC transporter substrate-binding protein n=1 Tax=Phormidium pseudopriestleyi FRX01 TaxID=1759528 RepID=A0ABS3FZV8_9CYAN|nr:zinc ABC transporter substrate-binding protein [Phormidium pseudopriestleyi]MBO0352344.1 zinc ABC transporter substrate-binding protein [Phormidium pseudopriestleyi FRX01]